MVFCIGKENSEKLSNYISHIINLLKHDDRITAVAMNSYIIHIPVNNYWNYPNLIDGLNIKLTLVCEDEIEYTNSLVNILKSKVLEELHYNITLDVISSSFLKENGELLKYLLADADIIYDHKGDLTHAKNNYFYYEKSYDAVEYQPKLNIRG